MSSLKNIVSPLAATTIVSLIFIASDSRANDFEDKSFFMDCPISNSVRVSNAQSAQRFEALGHCSDKLIQAAVPRVDLQPPVARIMGVKAEDDDAHDKKRSRKASKRAPVSGEKPVEVEDARITRASIDARPAYDGEIRQVAARYRIDPLFLHAMVAQESAARPRARSHKGALGLMQIMPSTGAMLGVAPASLFDPATNLDAGARYLKRLQKRFGTDFALILSAYNAGEGAVKRYGNRIPPFAETQAYVTGVMGRYGTLRLTSAAAPVASR